MRPSCALPREIKLFILISMNRLCFFIAAFVLINLIGAGFTGASQDSPITYSREKLVLIPKPEPQPTPEPLPDPKPRPLKPVDKKDDNELSTTKGEVKKGEAADELALLRIAPAPEPVPAPPPPRQSIVFIVDVRTPDFLDQDDVISQTVFAEREGLLISIDPPAVASLSGTQILGKADVIFINEDGYITRIAPKLNVNALREPISSGKPVRAILYLNSGSVEKERIIPGDRFENSMFKTYPEIIQ